MLLTARQVVTPARVLAPGWLRLEGDRVVAAGEGHPGSAADSELPSSCLVPGYVDAHVHGGGGAAFDSGRPEQAAVAARAHLAHGTTTMLASLVTDRVETLEAAIRALSPLVDDGVLAGIHLEGPWLSPAHCGAHDPGLLRAPEPADVDRLVTAAADRLRMVTLAPELPGGLEAVRRLTEAGVVAAVGHTDATYAVTVAALEAGARAGTHLFNAMRQLHHREPGPVAALLEHPDVAVELVADGVHLHPAVLRLAAGAKPDRTVLVTDAMAAATLGDGDYRLGPLSVHVRDGAARLAGSGAIAGSTLTMAAAVRHAVLQAGVPLVDAVRAATGNPAALLGLDDVGALEPGRRADLLVLDDQLQVRRVMRSGAWV